MAVHDRSSREVSPRPLDEIEANCRRWYWGIVPPDGDYRQIARDAASPEHAREEITCMLEHLDFSTWACLGRLKSAVVWLHRLGIVGPVVWLGRWLHRETPFALTVRRSS